jgi:hypothetical protein
MADKPDLIENLLHSAGQAERVEVDGVSIRRRSLADQIAATKFLMATRARSRSPMAGVSITKLIPHGAVLPDGFHDHRFGD